MMTKVIKLFLSIIIFIATDLFGQKPVYYSNPILSGFYPDPSICRAGGDYYLVTSSFAYFPGLPLFHSKDLVNWKQIGHAMDRASQLDHEGAGVSRGLFAPAIRFYKGTFYIVCTQIDKGGNFIITATDARGPWSDPVWIPEVNGIDPSLFIEDDSTAYLVYNSIPPGNISLYDGHRTIRMYEFDLKNLKVKGEEKILINGGTDITKKPVWIEAPHIFRKDGWYYLICAEGGTAYNHSEVVFRSRSIAQAFVPYENNPILTQRHLDTARKNPVTTTGHADFVETPRGDWYAVFLGCRPYQDNHYNIGRETFMVPVKWENGWPIILRGNEQVQEKYPVPFPAITKKEENEFSGKIRFRDEFDDKQLEHRWMFLRTVHEPWHEIKKGQLHLNLKEETCSGKRNPAFVGHRQQSHECAGTTMMEFTTTKENEKAGLLIFQNETHYYYLCKSYHAGKPAIQLYQGAPDSSMQLLESKQLPADARRIFLRIRMKGNTYGFAYSLNGNDWKAIENGLDARFLSTETAGGFVGSVFALYVTSMGKKSGNQAKFDWFEYRDE